MARFEYGCETEVICNDNNIFPAMKTLVEDEGLSVKAAARFVEEDSRGRVSRDRAESVYRRRAASHDANRKPPKKRTKPEAKIQLDESQRL